MKMKTVIISKIITFNISFITKKIQYNLLKIIGRF